MFIDELPVGSPVTLQITIDSKKFELVSIKRHNADLQEGNLHGILVEPFRHDGKLLKFDRGSFIAALDNIEDDKYYKFRLKAVTAVRHNNTVYHMLISKDDAKFVNRREAIRVPLATTISVQGSTNMTGRTKDISASGIAFVIDGLNAPEVGERLRCRFEKFYLTYNTSCKVVRCVKDKKNNCTLVGCEFERNYQNINELVNEIQMQNRPNRKR